MSIRSEIRFAKYCSVKCPSMKCLSVKCPSVKCPSVKCPSAKCLSAKCPSAIYPGASLDGLQTWEMHIYCNLNKNISGFIHLCLIILHKYLYNTAHWQSPPSHHHPPTHAPPKKLAHHFLREPVTSIWQLPAQRGPSQNCAAITWMRREVRECGCEDATSGKSILTPKTMSSHRNVGNETQQQQKFRRATEAFLRSVFLLHTRKIY